MTVRATLRSGDRVPASSPAQIPCCLGTCPLGVVGTSYAFDPGSDVAGVLGGGKLSQLILYLHATSGSRVVAVPTTGTYPALPSVTNSAGVPAVTVALTSGNTTGAYDDASVVVTYTGAGALGVAQASLSYDGTNAAETFTVPAEGPAVLRGNVDLTLGLDLEGLTVVFTAPSSKTITYAAGSLTASVAGLHAAITSAASTSQILTAGLITGGKTAILAHARRLKFTTSGVTASEVPATVDIVGTYRGAAQSETLALSQTAGAVLSAKPYDTITSLDFPVGQGTGGLLEIGYSSAFADGAEILAATIALLAASTALAGSARLPDVASGAQYLELYTTGVGTSTALTIDAATSTAEALVGFSSGASNLTTTGTAATRALPFLGVTLTFPSGTYPLNGTSSIPLVGPRSSVAALSAAATAAHDAYDVNPFGLLVTTEDFATMANASTALTTLAGLVNTWAADPAAPIYVRALVSSALHTPSSTKATNDTNILAMDAAFLAAFPATTPDSILDNVAVGDVYIPGAAGLPAGTYRRPASWAGASKVAGAAKIAANPADGGVFGATLLAPDGVTRARNENTATSKLGQLGGPGAWVLKSTSTGPAAPAFEICASRAGASSRLREPGAVAIGREIQRIVFGEVEVWNGQTWEGQAANPIAADVTETEPRAHHLEQLLRQTLQPDNGPPNVTAFDVNVTAPTLGNDNKVSVAAPFNPLNVVGIVIVSVTATGAAINSAG